MEADSEYESESETDSRASSHDMATEEVQKTGSDTSAVVYVLDRLHSPTPSDLAHKMKVLQKYF